MRRRHFGFFLLVVFLLAAFFGVLASGCGGVPPQVQATPTPTLEATPTPTPEGSPEPTVVVGMLIF